MDPPVLDCLAMGTVSMTSLSGHSRGTVKTQSSPPISIYDIHSSSSSSSPPSRLLLHGYPQSHHTWHLVAPQLTSLFSVVIMDIRGYGASSKPANYTALYAKSQMANDCIAVMNALGFPSQPSYVCGHDRGARVAHKLLVDHPTGSAKAFFHWHFLIQNSPLPETPISVAPCQVIETFLTGGDLSRLSMFHKDAVEERTSSTIARSLRTIYVNDLDEQRDDLAKGQLIQAPIRKQWTKVTAEGGPVQVEVVDSDHIIPEQIQDVVVSHILDIFP
ncbi:alpha/beta-hydrolase [Trichoderma novae-zelandiae]